MIMFLITATTCVGVVGSVYLAVLNIMNTQHRLCSEKILPRSAGTGVEHWVKAQALKVDCWITPSAALAWSDCSKACSAAHVYLQQ